MLIGFLVAIIGFLVAIIGIALFFLGYYIGAYEELRRGEDNVITLLKEKEEKLNEQAKTS